LGRQAANTLRGLTRVARERERLAVAGRDRDADGGFNVTEIADPHAHGACDGGGEPPRVEAEG